MIDTQQATIVVQSLGPSSREKYPYFGDTLIFLKYYAVTETCTQKNQFDPCIRYNTVSAWVSVTRRYSIKTANVEWRKQRHMIP